MENKFKEGETVYAKEAPTLALTIRRYIDEIYYCKRTDHPEQKELVYFQRELVGG
jgi:hypothetical protein